MIWFFLSNGLINGSLIAITALGFAIVYNTTRIFHIAYAALYTWAGYVFYWLYVINGFNFFLSVAIVVVFTVFLSILCEKLVYQPLSKKERSPNTLMISSIGILIVLVNLIALIFGNTPRIFPHNGFDLSEFSFYFISGIPFISFIVFNLTMILFFIILKYSSLGIKTRALRDDILLSHVFGIDTYRLRYILFGISGFLVAIAASFRSLDVGINPYVGLPVFIYAFVALVIGGVGRFEGPLLGGFILGILQALVEYFVDNKWVMLVTFGILMIFLIFRPEGLIPERKRVY